jgi:hypothetical protein
VNGFATDAPTGQSANNLRPPSEARGFLNLALHVTLNAGHRLHL